MTEKFEEKVIIIIEIDVSAKEWGLGHLPRFHTMFVSKFLELGYRVFSISPNKNYVQQHIVNNQAQLICFEHRELLNELNQKNNSTENNKRMKTKNTKFYLKKYLDLMLPPFIYSMGNFIFQNLRKRGPYHRWYYQNELNKYNEYIQYLTTKFNIKKDDVIIFIPFLDTLFSGYIDPEILDEKLPHNWWGLIISMQSFNKKNRISLNKSKYFRGLGILEEDKLLELQNDLTTKKIMHFPDIAMSVKINTDYPLLKQITHEANNRKKIGLLGFFAERKGVLNFLMSSFLAAENKPNDYFFVLAGASIFNKKYTLEYLNKSSHESNSLIYLSAITNDEDFVAVLNHCDIIYAAYLDFPGSSNVLSYAAFLKKPVIVSEGFLMEKRVKEYGIGLAIPKNEPQKCLAAIDCIVNGVDFDGKQLKFDYESYNRFHSYENLGQIIKNMFSSNNNGGCNE